MKAGGLARPAGDVGITVLRQGVYRPTKEDIVELGSPQIGFHPEVNAWRKENWPRVRKQWRRIATARSLSIPTFYGDLRLTVVRASGERLFLGLASLRVVTDTGVAFIVDAFQNLVELENMKYHGIGTGGTAEAAAQSALVAEITTGLAPDNTRATGTTAETAANIYQTVGTLTVDSAQAVTEHGVFSQAATGGGVMIDRSLFAAVNLASGDSIQTDYRLTFASGG